MTRPCLGIWEAIQAAKPPLCQSDRDRVSFYVRDKGMAPTDAVAHVQAKRAAERASGESDRSRSMFGMKSTQKMPEPEFRKLLHRKRAAKRAEERTDAAVYPRPMR